MTETSTNSVMTEPSTNIIEEMSVERPNRTINLRPSMDVFESDDSLLIHTDMPGVQKDDLHVELDGNTLTVKGTWVKESDSNDSNTEYTFKRDLRLNRPVDVDGISATLQDGLLRLSLPWTKAPEPRRISIN